MTVEKLIARLQNDIGRGVLDADSEVYVVEDIFPNSETSRHFTPILYAGTSPIFDKQNPSKQSLFICMSEQVLTDLQKMD